WFGGQQLGRVDQTLRRRKLTFRVDDLGTLFALRLGLFRHRTQHGFRHIHLLDLNVGYFHAPRRGVGVQNALQTQIDLVTVSKQFIKLLFAENGAQSSLRELRSLVNVVGNLNHSLARLNHAQENDGVNLQRDIVASDDVLRGDFQCFLTERDANHAIDGGEDKDEARSLGLR